MEWIISFIGLIGLILIGIYYLIIYYRFESRVQKENAIHQDAVNSLLSKTRVSGVLAGVSASLIIPPTTSNLIMYLFVLIFSILIAIWLLTTNTRRGIETLATKYKKD